MKNFRKILTIAIGLVVVSFAKADESSVCVPTLSSYADTESVTNVAFLAGGENSRLFRLRFELDASVSNNVSVAFGTDGNGDGVLDREEMDVVMGWDSGTWCYRDRSAEEGSTTSRPDGRRCIEWRLILRPDRTAKALFASDADGAVFQSAVPSTMFNPAWNLMQVSARGLTESDGIVVSEISGWGFRVILR